MSKVTYILVSSVFLLSSVALADRAKNPMVDEFITGVGGNYGGAAISTSAQDADVEIARQALRVCKAKGKAVSQIYNVQINLEADYEVVRSEVEGNEVNGQSVAKGNPIWTFSARVTCQ